MSKLPNLTEGRERSPIGDSNVRPVLPILLVGNANWLWFQWEFQDPKMEVLYHIRAYVVGIFTYIGLT